MDDLPERGPSPATQVPWLMTMWRVLCKVLTPTDTRAACHRVTNWDALYDAAEQLQRERDLLARVCGSVIVAATLQPGEELLDDTEDATVRAALRLVRQRNEALAELTSLRAELAKRDICWHCFDQLSPEDNGPPRCYFCPPECDVLGCSAPGCRGEEPVIG